jgi:hypothetical protein
MRKRKASLYPSSQRSALPLLPVHSRFLVEPNCWPAPSSTALEAPIDSVQGPGSVLPVI